MKRSLPCLALAALLVAGPGCFVLDELDNSNATMSERSMDGTARRPAGEAPAPKPSPGARTSQDEGTSARVAVSEWWKNARTPTSGPKDGATSTEIVTCRLGGEILFMSKTDCEVQGGRF